MKNKYKVPWHVRQYVKKELTDYKANKKLIAKCKGDTRGIILANIRLTQIENVLNSLNKEDREAFAVKVTTKLYKAPKFVWTVNKQEELDTAHKNGELPIFENIF